MRRLLLFVLVVLGIFIVENTFATQYNFRHLNYTNGLSNNRILCTIEDNNGFIWFGTTTGLNRYDGYKIKTYQHVVGDTSSLIDNMILALEKDGQGNLWISTSKGIMVFNTQYETCIPIDNLFSASDIAKGKPIDYVKAIDNKHMLLRSNNQQEMFTYNIENGSSQLFNPKDSTSTISNDYYVSGYTERNGLIYIVYTSGRLKVVDFMQNRVIRITDEIVLFVKEDQYNFNLYIDNIDRIWMYSNNADLGLFCIDNNNKLIMFNTQSKPALNSNIISGVLQDEDGKFWVGTDHGGVNVLNTELTNIEYLLHDKNSKTAISQNAITYLYKSSNQIIWVGTFKKGVSYYHPKLFKFNHYSNNPGISNSLPVNDVNCFVEDEQGNLLIGTNGKGLIKYDRTRNEFSRILDSELSKTVIVSLFIDKNKTLWIGTYYGGLIKYDGKRLHRYLHEPENNKSICDNRVWSIYEDSENNLWIGTLGGGLDLFDRDRGIFVHYKGNGVNSIKSLFVLDIAEDINGNIWFTTDNGVFCLNKNSSRFFHYNYQNGVDSSLSSFFVNKVFVDSKNNLWFGTREGLNLFNREHQSFLRLNTDNGLPSNAIMGIQESNQGDLWVSTASGLCNIILEFDDRGNYKSHYTINFNESDGLQGREFNDGSSYKTSKGELIFGGSNGFNMFIPAENYRPTEPIKVLINGLKVFGRDYNQFHSKERIPEILNDQQLSLSSSESIFSLDYVVVDPILADKITYRYKLQGFNDQWIYTDWKERKSTYTNLNHGKYELIVQASVFNSDWKESQGSMILIIDPPWYRTVLAYIIYYILLMLMIYFLRKAIVTGERIKYQKDEAEKETLRQQELNVLKTRFFTNVSHEFRTPLTLIITPLEKLLKSNIDADVRKHLELINLNANRLLQLVNQLLDFRKAEENKLKLNLIYGNAVGFIHNIVQSFTTYTESKNIKLEFLPHEQAFFMQFDKDKIEKIILNLLSNAFKFTNHGGFIKVYTHLITRHGSEYLEIKVQDNGIGISREDQDKIFERFYQANVEHENISKGSGIGLSLINEFVQLHGGTIRLNSEEAKGSTFIVNIPAIKDPVKNEQNNEVLQDSESDESQLEIKRDGTKQILLVEDNDEFRFYLKDSLQEKYRIFEAGNGKQALNIMEAEDIHLVVSDVMMPEMDGFQLCNIMKAGSSFSHIPIILLTAKSTQQDKLDGLKYGADEYITKPFSFDILNARINYLLGLREKFIKQYQQSFNVSFNNQSITPIDKEFLDKATELIRSKISNSEFSVEKMSKELGMSRVYLYKKINALTGNTPIELIRLMRLKKAAELLMEGKLNVSEITYEVGFSDPKYFSKLFKAEFGALPSKYKEQNTL